MNAASVAKGSPGTASVWSQPLLAYQLLVNSGTQLWGHDVGAAGIEVCAPVTTQKLPRHPGHPQVLTNEARTRDEKELALLGMERCAAGSHTDALGGTVHGAWC